LIDGFNLSLAAGSGIATYARNLASAVEGLGHSTAFLYGPDGALGRNPLLNEIALSDAAPRPQSRWRHQLDTALSPLGRTARHVPAGGFVLGNDPRRPAADAWAAQDLFHRANRAHGRFGRFTPVTIEAPGASLMHWTCPLPLTARGMPNIVTLHDLVPLRLPFATLDNKRRFHSLVRRITGGADHVVTVSETVRREVISLFGIEEKRITATGQSAEVPAALAQQPEAQVAAEVGGMFRLAWKDYFLWFGAIEPKKNLGRLVEAYLGSGVRTPLVIVAGQAWLDAPETRLIREDLIGVQVIRDHELRRSDRIRRYDYLPFATLVGLIRGAKATLFPSLYEGFGLPALESMQLGTPVLASSGGALPEVVGDAALSVDPYDVQSIRSAIQALDTDAGLRGDLAARGVQRAQLFSPEAYRQRLAPIYESLI
jgi:glycosyltransferase involved in cell wall biosynthesis